MLLHNTSAIKSVWWYRRQRARLYRLKRVLFASPAEIMLLRLMGGSAITIDPIKSRHGFPLTFVISMGGFFGRENMKREVRVGKHWVDFGNDIKRGIEVDGEAFHKDVVKQYERDEYFKKQDWLVLHIRPADMFANPDKVQRLVIDFLVK